MYHENNSNRRMMIEFAEEDELKVIDHINKVIKKKS